MDLVHNLYLGFSVALLPTNIMYCFLGAFLGTVIGVLPGIGPLATIAMLLPLTTGLSPTSSLIMLAGIYYGAQYGGSTTAILINLPGEASSAVTVIDGYQMARRGRAGPALAAAALGSFFAGSVGPLVLAAFAAPLIEVALRFGAAEYVSLMVLGLIGAIVLASGSVLKAIGMILIGLLLGTEKKTAKLQPQVAMDELEDIETRRSRAGLDVAARAAGEVQDVKLLVRDHVGRCVAFGEPLRAALQSEIGRRALDVRALRARPRSGRTNWKFRR